ncbi:ATP synthase F0 subunit B [PVC group bacterium (ex Bugula neritina AB1)]|nr:ATP synthase F0 subunit B [PVC group bacterium (ex Bugula neritina AB1)]
MDINWPTIVLQTLGFLLLVSFMKKFFYGPVLGMLDDRSSKTKKLWDDADKYHSEAKEKLKEADLFLSQAKEEAISIGKKARSMGSKQKDALIEKGKTEAARLVQRGQEDVERHVEKTKEELKDEVFQIAISLSEKLLMREMSLQDRKKYFSIYSKDIEKHL